ncbi:YitT family protein [Lactococcus termiticola]|uniref:YitT family membrane protein n=1 Tax=Lactococcus termiticola TaxID=2169526 RepID=A0A2R5HED4_9LACT|nr:YitT family protein [Lactococcus termiticola]GBG96454.1 YitT family membrane protein [Lactococcus termiticola]
MKKDFSLHAINFIAITLGTVIYAFGFVEFNIANNLAEGGLAGVTLITRALFHLDPSYMQIVFNVPLLFIGYKFLGKRTFTYTIYAIISLSVFIWLFQRLDFGINIDHDTLIAAILAGVFAGAGVGIVFRYGGTTGGSDIIAQLLQFKKGIQVGKTFFAIDAIVLTLSLSYIPLTHMMYTLIASFVAAQVIGIVQNGGYTVRGMLIMTDKPDELARAIVNEIGRTVTFLNGTGAYSGAEKKVIYAVLNPSEIQEVKEILSVEDPKAFASIINVHEVIGDFNYPKSRFLVKK